MDTWTQQMGFPLITISRDENEILAIQERFLLTTENMNSSNRLLPKSKYDYKWYIPLTYITENDTETVHTIWMNMTDGNSFKTKLVTNIFRYLKYIILVRFELDTDVRWIKANINQSGFYRVMYDESMWYAIIETLKTNHTIFSPADRSSLLDDAFTLCRYLFIGIDLLYIENSIFFRAGFLNASIPLELSQYLINERDYVPWATAIEHFQAWSRRLSESLAYKLFLKYMRKLLTPVTKYVSWSDKGSHLDK